MLCTIRGTGQLRHTVARLQTLVFPSLSWSVLRIPLLHSTSACLPPLVPRSAPVGAKAWRNYQDGGMTGLEGAEEGLEVRLVFRVGLWVQIIPLGHVRIPTRY